MTEAPQAPLVGDIVSISELRKEYENSGPKYAARIDELALKYSGIRRILGDGNCFYRAFAFRLLEILSQTKAAERAALLLNRMDHLSHLVTNELKMMEAFIYEDIEGVLREQVEALAVVGDADSTLDLEALFREQGMSDYVVSACRFSASAILISNADAFASFLPGFLAVEEGDAREMVSNFVKSNVEPMNVEADHECIAALVNAFQVPLSVEYVDQSGSSMCHEFEPSITPPPAGVAVELGLGLGEERQARLVLLYRPGHYDIVYE